MLCRQTEVVPAECIARGYITGSGWKDYQNSGAVCGIQLPEGLRNSDRLAQPLFTPSTKAVDGHDENISFAEGAEIVGEVMQWWRENAELTVRSRLRWRARHYSRGHQVRFGQIGGSGEPILIDEYTPDSSRFWPADDWEPGREQVNFDKQIVRNYLETVVASGEWDKNPPGPALPAEVIERGIARYLSLSPAYRRASFPRFTDKPHFDAWIGEPTNDSAIKRTTGLPGCWSNAANC